MSYLILKAVHEWAKSEAANLKNNEKYRETLGKLANVVREVMAYN